MWERRFATPGVVGRALRCATGQPSLCTREVTSQFIEHLRVLHLLAVSSFESLEESLPSVLASTTTWESLLLRRFRVCNIGVLMIDKMSAANILETPFAEGPPAFNSDHSVSTSIVDLPRCLWFASHTSSRKLIGRRPPALASATSPSRRAWSAHDLSAFRTSWRSCTRPRFLNHQSLTANRGAPPVAAQRFPRIFVGRSAEAADDRLL